MKHALLAAVAAVSLSCAAKAPRTSEAPRDTGDVFRASHPHLLDNLTSSLSRENIDERLERAQSEDDRAALRSLRQLSAESILERAALQWKDIPGGDRHAIESWVFGDASKRMLRGRLSFVLTAHQPAGQELVERTLDALIANDAATLARLERVKRLDAATQEYDLTLAIAEATFALLPPEAAEHVEALTALRDDLRENGHARFVVLQLVCLREIPDADLDGAIAFYESTAGTRHVSALRSAVETATVAARDRLSSVD